MSKYNYFFIATIGITFVASSISKLISINSFIDIINQFAEYWNITISNIITKYLAYLIILTELLLAIFLLINFKPKVMLLISLALFIGFSILTTINYIDEYTPVTSCGCFGEVFIFSPLGTLLKNLVLVLITTVALIQLYRNSKNIKSR